MDGGGRFGPGGGSGKVVDVVDWRPTRPHGRSSSTTRPAWAASPLFTADGEHVVAGVFWDPYNRDGSRGSSVVGRSRPAADLVGIHVWDADTGELVAQYDVGRCGGYLGDLGHLHVLVRTLHGSADVVAACDWAQGTIGTELVDRRSGERRLLAENSGTNSVWGAATGGDGAYVAYDDTQDQHEVVVAATDGRTVLRFTPAPGPECWCGR